jgi:hypothetical protein
MSIKSSHAMIVSAALLAGAGGASSAAAPSSMGDATAQGCGRATRPGWTVRVCADPVVGILADPENVSHPTSGREVYTWTRLKAGWR